MVELRVFVEDVESGSVLSERLTRIFNTATVSFDRQLREIRIQTERKLNRAVVVALATLEVWLDEETTCSATLCVGGRSHILAAATRRYERPAIAHG